MCNYGDCCYSQETPCITLTGLITSFNLLPCEKDDGVKNVDCNTISSIDKKLIDKFFDA